MYQQRIGGKLCYVSWCEEKTKVFLKVDKIIAKKDDWNDFEL